MTSFALPDLGEGLVEAEIVSWHVAPGDRVVPGQPLAAVETAKAVVEIPSPQAGRIAAIHGKPGDILKVGAPLVEFVGDTAESAAPALVGVLPEAAQQSRNPVRISPALRARARQLGVDLAGIVGSGPDGVITSADLESACPSQGAGQVIALRGARRSMADNMARSGSAIVPATVTEVADISIWPDKSDVTLRLILALRAAVLVEPRLNARYDPAVQALTLHDHINMGLAQDTAEGLFVPTLRMRMTEPPNRRTLRCEINRLKAAVVDRSLAPAELAEQTITLSNFGMLGGLHASLVIVPPQVAIIGAGRIFDGVRMVDGQAKPSRLLPLSLSFDHRAITGGEAVRFLMAMQRHLEGEDRDDSEEEQSDE